jgi:dienelactone hydrolase
MRRAIKRLTVSVGRCSALVLFIFSVTIQPGLCKTEPEGTKPLTEPAPWIEDRWPMDAARVRSIVLVLHGGQARSPTTGRRWPQLSYLRMVPFARLLHRREGERGLSVRILRYRYRGWDEPQLHPVQDARWALTQLYDQHSDASIVLLGHSMGARAALRVADHPAVRAVCALAPWIPDDEPVRQLAGRSVLIAHGDRERTTDPRLSYRFAMRAKQITSRVCRFDVLGDGHAMLRRAHDWSELTARFVATELRLRTPDPLIEDAMHRPAPEGLRVPLPAMTQDRWWR